MSDAEPHIRSNTGSHKDKENSFMILMTLWFGAAMCLLVSLFIVEKGGEAGYIYLRATAILYLSLTMSEGNVVPRGIRVGVGCLMIILALDATVPVPDNVPLYLSTALLVTHIVLSILTYPSANLMSITGLRGTVFILLGVVCSTFAVVIGFTVQFSTGIAIARDISFGLTGLPLMFLSNGVPVTEKDQLIGSFACLVPIAGAMYLSGGVQSTQVWLLLATGMSTGICSAALCVSTVSTWKASLMQMWRYLTSGKTTAFFIIIVMTFANIACINGTSVSVEAERCYTFPDIAGRTCIKGVQGLNPYKGIEQAIPLIMMGLAKGPLVVLVLMPLQSNMGEMNAWAMTTVLSTAALILFGIEGRGRCIFTSTKDCEMDRSQGFLSGLAIGSMCTLACLARCIYCGYIVPWRLSRMKLALGGNGGMGRGSSLSKGCWSRAGKRLGATFKNKDVPVAIAIGALLICLISTSMSTLTVTSDTAESTIANAESVNLHRVTTVISSNLVLTENITATAVSDVMRSAYVTTCYPVVTAPHCNMSQEERFAAILGSRMNELEEYWQTTAWSISGAILAMSFLILETLPGSPAVAVSIMAGLLLTAGRIHYGCLLSSVNDRLLVTGVRVASSVELNVYIISTISIVVGLAWGGSIVRGESARKTKDSMAHRLSVNPTQIQLTVCRNGSVVQTFAEMFEVLLAAGVSSFMIQGGLIKNWSRTGNVDASGCTWDIVGNCELVDGTYVIEDNIDELIMMAQACAGSIGVLSLLKRVEPVRVPVLILNDKAV